MPGGLCQKAKLHKEVQTKFSLAKVIDDEGMPANTRSVDGFSCDAFVCVHGIASWLRRRIQAGMAERMGKDPGRGKEGRTGRGLHQRLRRDSAGVSKGISGDQSRPDHGPRFSAWPALARRTESGKIFGGRGQRRRRDHIPATFPQQGFRSDQAGAAVAGDHRYLEMVPGQASLLGPGKSIHLQLRRHCDLRLDQLQHETDQCEGGQILLGSAGA